MIKVICIKECDGLFGATTCFIDQVYYSSPIVNENESESAYYQIYENDRFGYFFGLYERENFMILSEFREQRINKILND